MDLLYALDAMCKLKRTSHLIVCGSRFCASNAGSATVVVRCLPDVNKYHEAQRLHAQSASTVLFK